MNSNESPLVVDFFARWLCEQFWREMGSSGRTERFGGVEPRLRLGSSTILEPRPRTRGTTCWSVEEQKDKTDNVEPPKATYRRRKILLTGSVGDEKITASIRVSLVIRDS